jgi:hypothetical protein
MKQFLQSLKVIITYKKGAFNEANLITTFDGHWKCGTGR